MSCISERAELTKVASASNVMGGGCSGGHLGAAVLAEVGDAGGEGRAAGQAAQPHLGKAHDAARVRAGCRQRYAASVRACKSNATK